MVGWQEVVSEAWMVVEEVWEVGENTLEVVGGVFSAKDEDGVVDTGIVFSSLGLEWSVLNISSVCFQSRFQRFIGH